MRKLLLGAVASTAMFLGTMQASAADIEVAPEPMGWSWYVSVFGGWSMADEIDGDFATGATTYEVELDLDDGFTAGIAVGAHINEWLRGEIELSGNWHDADGEVGTTADTTPTEVDGDVDAMFVLANLWLDLPIGDVIRPYVGGGVGFGHLSVEVDTTGGTTLFDESDWGFAYQLGAGVAFDFAENIAFDIGYRFKAINNADIEVDSDFGTFDDFEADYQSHNIIAGIRIGL